VQRRGAFTQRLAIGERREDDLEIGMRAFGRVRQSVDIDVGLKCELVQRVKRHQVR
jgi:hypothetical protein